MYFSDLFWLFWVGRKVRISRLCCQNFKQTIFFGRYDIASGSLFNDFFQSQTASQKFWDNSIKRNLLGFSLEKLKDSSIKIHFHSPISMLWVFKLSAPWPRCNLQTHQHWSNKERGKLLQKVVVSIYFAIGCKCTAIVVLVFLLLTLNVFHTFFYCFCYWIWTNIW